jgi:hypothetical protein
MNSIGQILICRDSYQLQIARQQYPNNKVVVLDDKDYNGYGFINGSLLLPTLDALSHQVDGSYADFVNYYLGYLYNDPDVTKFVTLLVTALYKGVNILLFLGESDPSMFMDQFMNFLRSRGIFAIPFEMKRYEDYIPAVNTANLVSWLPIMLSFGYITQEEYNSRFIQKDGSPFQTFVQ